jgi:hypothetical protein
MKVIKSVSMAVCLVMLAVLLSVMTGSAEASEKSPPVVSLSKAYNWKMTAWFPAGHDDNKQLVQFIDTHQRWSKDNPV